MSSKMACCQSCGAMMFARAQDQPDKVGGYYDLGRLSSPVN